MFSAGIICLIELSPKNAVSLCCGEGTRAKISTRESLIHPGAHGLWSEWACSEVSLGRRVVLFYKAQAVSSSVEKNSSWSGSDEDMGEGAASGHRAWCLWEQGWPALY